MCYMRSTDQRGREFSIKGVAIRVEMFFDLGRQHRGLYLPRADREMTPQLQRAGPRRAVVVRRQPGRDPQGAAFDASTASCNSSSAPCRNSSALAPWPAMS